MRSDNHCSKPARLHDQSIREDYVVMSDGKRGATFGRISTGTGSK